MNNSSRKSNVAVVVKIILVAGMDRQRQAATSKEKGELDQGCTNKVRKRSQAKGKHEQARPSKHSGQVQEWAS